MASCNPSCPLEVAHVVLAPSEHADRHPIKLSVWYPSASAIIVSRVPRLALADRPLDIAMGGPSGLQLDSSSAESLTRSIALHANLSIIVEGSGGLQTPLLVPVTIRRSDSGWVARALVCPATWANAKSVAVDGVTFAGRPLPCAYLPAVLRVGYNHTWAPAGAVLAAAQAGDVRALQTALEDGMSTEEVDEVRGSEGVISEVESHATILRLRP